MYMDNIIIPYLYVIGPNAMPAKIDWPQGWDCHKGTIASDFIIATCIIEHALSLWKSDKDVHKTKLVCDVTYVYYISLFSKRKGSRNSEYIELWCKKDLCLAGVHFCSATQIVWLSWNIIFNDVWLSWIIIFNDVIFSWCCLDWQLYVFECGFNCGV